MFTLQIQCMTIEDAERVLFATNRAKGPVTVSQVAEPSPVDTALAALPRMPASDAPNFDDVRAALKAVQAKYGENDLAMPLTILKQFGAARVGQVKESDFPAFITACAAA